MRSNTEQIAIDAPAGRVFAHVADAAKLPTWATGFARAIRRDGDGWTVDTPLGEVGLRIDGDAASGVVDYRMEVAPGVVVTAPTRVVPHGAATVYVFTQLQPEGMPDEVFERQIETLREELSLLKRQLETARTEAA